MTKIALLAALLAPLVSGVVSDHGPPGGAGGMSYDARSALAALGECHGRVLDRQEESAATPEAIADAALRSCEAEFHELEAAGRNTTSPARSVDGAFREKLRVELALMIQDRRSGRPFRRAPLLEWEVCVQDYAMRRMMADDQAAEVVDRALFECRQLETFAQLEVEKSGGVGGWKHFRTQARRQAIEVAKKAHAGSQ